MSIVFLKPDQYPGIGGSDISVILGLNKYRSPLDLWEEHKGIKESFQGNLSTGIGLALEEFNIERYQDKTGNVVRPAAPELQDGWYRRSMDGFIHKYGQPVHKDQEAGEFTPDRIIVYEGKTSFSFGAKKMFGPEEDGDEAIPEYYQLQVQWYMAKRYQGLMPEEAHLSALLTSPEHRVYTIKRDPEICDRILQFAEHWWKTHIIGDIPPDESTTDTGRGISDRITNGNLIELKETSEIAKYRLAKSAYDKAKKDLEKEKKRVIKIIGDNEGVRGIWGKMTYKPYISHRLNRKKLTSHLTSHVGKEVAEDIINQSCTQIKSERFKADFFDKEKANG